MSNSDEKYIEIFYSEALENFEELNKSFTLLEKNPTDKDTIENIFRITHTLKGNAMGLGVESIASLSHIMEDIFVEIKEYNIELNEELFSMLFKANDKLGELIEALKTKKEVSYKGIRTKLEVYLRKKKEPEGKRETQNQERETPTLEDLDKITMQEAESEPTSSTSQGREKTDVNTEELLEEEQEVSTSKLTFSDQIQVSVSKLDNLLNLVGELMIEKDALIAKNHERKGQTDFSRLNRITSDLQYGVMDVRLVQIGFFFNKFYRTVRDAASIEGKKVNLALEGTEIEIDRNILKSISDSMIHLIRNAVGHGIEQPKGRKKSGKSEEGVLTLSARNDKDHVIISIADDGAGIDSNAIRKKALEKGVISEQYAKQMNDDDALMLIFEPGFSNADKITEISGRGVGMDVVKRSVESIGGRVSVKTDIGIGTTIELYLPSSMAVKGALLFELNLQQFAIPLSYTEAVVSLYKKDLFKVSGGLMANYLDKTIPITFLNDIFSLHALEEMHSFGNLHKSYEAVQAEQKLDVLVVSYNNKWMGIIVDKLIQQKEIVEKSLFKPLDSIELFSGATILGDGNVCLVLDASSILRTFFSEKLTA